MTGVETLTAAQKVLAGLVAKVNETNLKNPTPCSEWDVRALLNHIVNENVWAPDMFAGKTIAEVGDKYDGDLLGDDPLGTWQASSKEALTTMSRPAAADQTIHTSYGNTSGQEYINQMAVDQVIHAWDLAQGLGESFEVPDEVIDYCLAFLEPQAEAWRGSGAFGKKVDIPADANPLTKLLALSGRTSE